MTVKDTFNKLRWIPKYFSKKIYLSNTLYTGKDLLQELDIALYLAIRKYIKLKIMHREPNVDMTIFCFKICEDKKNDLIRRLKACKRENIVPFGNELEVGVQHNNCSIEFDEDDDITNFKLDFQNVIELIEDEKRKEVFKLMILGFSYKEIMDKAQISLNILKKYNKQNRELLRRFTYVTEKVFVVENFQEE